MLLFVSASSVARNSSETRVVMKDTIICGGVQGLLCTKIYPILTSDNLLEHRFNFKT